MASDSERVAWGTRDERAVAEPYAPASPVDGGEVGGYSDIGSALGVDSRVVYNWFQRRDKNGFPKPVIERAPRPTGRPGPLFKMSAVLEWHRNYKPAKGGRPKMDDAPQPEFEHQWPNGTTGTEHLWGPWYAQRGLPKPTQYRQCQHPLCNSVESRIAPVA